MREHCAIGLVGRLMQASRHPSQRDFCARPRQMLQPSAPGPKPISSSRRILKAVRSNLQTRPWPCASPFTAACSSQRWQRSAWMTSNQWLCRSCLRQSSLRAAPALPSMLVNLFCWSTATPSAVAWKFSIPLTPYSAVPLQHSRHVNAI